MVDEVDILQLLEVEGEMGEALYHVLSESLRQLDQYLQKLQQAGQLAQLRHLWFLLLSLLQFAQL